MVFDFTGKTVWVTGAGKGIGYATALAFAEAGAQAITEAISSAEKPDVLIVMSPDLNSYSKLLKKAQQTSIILPKVTKLVLVK